ncbi:hypothetical protein [Bittarella massiliensis (ex Durand et al. 2017)]|uniref:hypothetical protein n=1 Tax=Bittarella massiliensis (ex Durand et al. 2017) TaxID=1720313 RepID=UPI001AA14256|nr:hypothetical protein [Bittarella massiliensis (ex Durand et al. 2017)]MBO1680541.1 hypothetical protein [Bittarella massiliensis (ex Durand et al. 2017)]
MKKKLFAIFTAVLAIAMFAIGPAMAASSSTPTAHGTTGTYRTGYLSGNSGYMWGRMTGGHSGAHIELRVADLQPERTVYSRDVAAGGSASTPTYARTASYRGWLVTHGTDYQSGYGTLYVN